MLRAVKNGAESEIMMEPTALRITDIKEYSASLPSPVGLGVLLVSAFGTVEYRTRNRCEMRQKDSPMAS
jgi:hypothetical protein